MKIFSKIILFVTLNSLASLVFADNENIELNKIDKVKDIAFLQSGNPEQATNLPFLPVFITIGLSHFSQTISVFSSSRR